jgi:hypothetical protein
MFVYRNGIFFGSTLTFYGENPPPSSVSRDVFRWTLITMIVIHWSLLTVAQSVEPASRDAQAVSLLRDSIQLLGGQQFSTPGQKITLSMKNAVGDSDSQPIQTRYARLPGSRCRYADFHLRNSQRNSEMEPSLSDPTSHAQTTSGHAGFPFLLPGALLQCFLEDPSIEIQVVRSLPATEKDDPSVPSIQRRTKIVFRHRATEPLEVAWTQLWSFDSATKLPATIEDIRYKGALFAPPAIGPFQSRHSSADLRGPRTSFVSFQLIGATQFPLEVNVETPGSAAEAFTLQPPTTAIQSPSE